MKALTANVTKVVSILGVYAALGYLLTFGGAYLMDGSPWG